MVAMKSRIIICFLLIVVIVGTLPGCMKPDDGPSRPDRSTPSPTLLPAAGPDPAFLDNIERVHNEYTSVGTIKSTTVTRYVRNRGDPGEVYLSLTRHGSQNTSSLLFHMDRDEVIAVSYRSGGIVVIQFYDLDVRAARPGDVQLNELSGSLFIDRDVNQSDYMA
ncbi:MAG: hypothetical protein A4E28_01332 [Methanocella sp. PtaU1.Bin125]|nr:MAG: hypothetical protein A4E28_01332 [Methanocella sp. PtaU1.Bin125]